MESTGDNPTPEKKNDTVKNEKIDLSKLDNNSIIKGESISNVSGENNVKKPLPKIVPKQNTESDKTIPTNAHIENDVTVKSAYDAVNIATDAEKKLANHLDKKAAESVEKFRKEGGNLLMSDGTIKQVTRRDKEGMPRNIGYWKDGQKIQSKTINQNLLSTPKSTLLRSAANGLRYYGHLFDVKTIRDMSMGKMGIGDAVMSTLSSGMSLYGPPQATVMLIAGDIVASNEKAKADEVTIEVALKQGYEATKQLLENSKTVPARMIYVTHAELEQIMGGKIDNSLQLSNPNNENINNWALLVSSGGNHNFTVFGGFFLK